MSTAVTLPDFRGQFASRGVGAGDSGVVDRQVQTAEGTLREGHHGFHLRGDGHIHLEGRRRGAQLRG